MKIVNQIKNYNENKGFGFVATEIRVDAFVHVSKLKHIPEPYVDRWISYDVERTDKGLIAVNIIDCQAEKLVELEAEAIAREERYAAINKKHEEDRAEGKRRYLEFIENVQAMDLDTLTPPELDELSRDLTQGSYSVEWPNFEAIHEKVEDLQRTARIMLGKNATELNCITCDLIQPKSEFEIDDCEPFRDERSNRCNTCIEVEANEFQADLDIIQAQLDNLETITKKDLKNLVRKIMATEAGNWSGEMNIVNEAVLFTVICAGSHSTPYHAPDRTGGAIRENFKVSKTKCFSITRWRSPKGNWCSQLQMYKIQGTIDERFETVKADLITNLKK